MRLNTRQGWRETEGLIAVQWLGRVQRRRVSALEEGRQKSSTRIESKSDWKEALKLSPSRPNLQTTDEDKFVGIEI